jgi:hypothetical protein
LGTQLANLCISDNDQKFKFPNLACHKKRVGSSVTLLIASAVKAFAINLHNGKLPSHQTNILSASSDNDRSAVPTPRSIFKVSVTSNKFSVVQKFKNIEGIKGIYAHGTSMKMD